MITFLPYQNFDQCAACLDRQRLGKQRVEVLQILRTLNGTTPGWRQHPAVRMWHGYTEALVEYGVAICDEWIRRGYKDTCRARIVAFSWGDEVVTPPWLTRRMCLGYRSNLLRKMPEHYRQFWPTLRDDLPYYWPTRKGAT